jgi:hypothetical protein
VSAPATPFARSVDLDGRYTHRSTELPEALRPPVSWDRHGDQVIRGLPFRFGPAEGRDVILLEREAVTVPLAGQASYVLVVHVVTDDQASGGGRAFGAEVSRYVLAYADGGEHVTPVHRRFAIQQGRLVWGASATAAVPAADDVVRRRVRDELAISGSATTEFGGGEVSHASPRDAATWFSYPPEMLWIYALPNPRPEAELQALRLEPGAEVSAVYAVSLTTLAEHPLRSGRRRTLRLRVPEGARRNALGELEGVSVDLGAVLTARPVLLYDEGAWLPRACDDEVLVELAAHPAAELHVERDGSDPLEVRVVPPAEHPVRVRIVDAGGAPVAARLHVHGEDGQYLPPRGHHRHVNVGWFEDLYAELAIDRQQYAYVDGGCIVDLPLGTVHVEISRGYEAAPLRQTFEVTAETGELTFTLERVLRWREQGWVTADTHVHFLSPQTALLEGRAEGVNVVNLLASQWGEMFSNVGDFDGATTLGARELGGDGEFLVRVGTENRQQVLGHISLLGYAGEMIHPLCTGGASESAHGDPVEVAMAEWAERCRAQGGLVVMPHAPDPQLERAADLVLGLVDAVELMSFNGQLHPEPLSPYGLADWYRYLNLGHQLPLVGGSDKMDAGSLLGGIRTYARLADRELGYQAWMDAVRGGDTFVTVGPLASLAVEGVRPGGRLELPAGGGRVTVEWQVESVALGVERVEVVAGGEVADEVVLGGKTSASGSAEVTIGESSWIALRVRGGYHGRSDDVAAHTSAVMLTVGGRPHFREQDAADVLDQIQGAIAYVDTLATRADVRHHQRLRTVLEGAYTRLHQRLHAAGAYHRHPLHDPATPHEH